MLPGRPLSEEEVVSVGVEVVVEDLRGVKEVHKIFYSS